MDYLGIYKRAYEIISKHRYLWLFGILIGGSASGSFLNYGFQGSNSLTNVSSSTYTAWQNFLSNTSLLIVIGAIISVIFLVWTVFGIIANGAILGSVRSINLKQGNDFYHGFSFGTGKFWRILALVFLFLLIILLSLAVLAVPIVLFVIAKIYVLAIIYGIVIFLADLILWVYLGLLSQYILREVVLGGKGSWEAIETSFHFFCCHWKDILLIYLLMIAVNIVVGIAFIIAFLVVVGILVLVGYALYLVSQAACIIYAIIFGFLLLLTLITWHGIYASFQSTVYTLAYLEMTK